MRKVSLTVIATAALCAACTSSGGTVATPSAPTTAAHPFAALTCRQWLREAAAERVDDVEGLLVTLHAFQPSHDLAVQVADGVATDCRVAPSLRFAEVMGTFATLDTQDFPR